MFYFGRMAQLFVFVVRLLRQRSGERVNGRERQKKLIEQKKNQCTLVVCFVCVHRAIFKRSNNSQCRQEWGTMSRKERNTSDGKPAYKNQHFHITICQSIRYIRTEAEAQ